MAVHANIYIYILEQHPLRIQQEVSSFARQAFVLLISPVFSHISLQPHNDETRVKFNASSTNNSN
jgi:hypothetical protein